MNIHPGFSIPGKPGKTEMDSLEASMATAIRVLTMDAVQAACSGHPGAPMGLADIATVLFNRFIRLDPADPAWPDRDRFILSAGHGSMLIYAIHHLLGYPDMDSRQLRNFRQHGSRTAGHPEYGHAKGIETTTGPLGQGLSNAVGMALAERMMHARFGDTLVDHYTYVIAGDGCLMEGISHEAIDLAGHLRLARLILLWDNNGITIDGSTNLSTSTDQCARFAAAGWHVAETDGHDRQAVAEAIASARADPRPSFIACKTVIGYGAPNKQGSAAVHGAPLGEDEIIAARKAFDWPHAAFDIPPKIKKAWHSIAERGATTRQAWQARHDSDPQAAAFDTALSNPDAGALDMAIRVHKQGLAAQAPRMATRKASEMALQRINEVIPNTIGGSADLTGSNNTRTPGLSAVTRDDFSGRYIHYGVREHAMAAAMNGIALHGGFRPYGGSFLVFTDYCRPAIRLSALMGIPVVYVMTHDSIGLGEDGPTHQPVEHIASLRAMPNILTFRPGDAVETAEAWQIAMTETQRPSVLCLSRQSLPTLRTSHCDDNLLVRGAYVLRAPEGDSDVTLIATGSELHIALAAADKLASAGISARLVSAPCFELFAEQDSAYRASVLGSVPRVGVEAAVRQSWETMLETNDAFVGMSGFGASAPAADLYRHFGISAEAVAKTAKALL